jgi:8-oxo-dGTP pyrophosphatase MutT (NUDIX family)
MQIKSSTSKASLSNGSPAKTNEEITCGIYLFNTRIKKILIAHASRSKNGWSIPKGLKEKDESSFIAAARELYEETNIRLKELHVLAVYELSPVRYEKKKNKILESFLVMTDTDLSEVGLKCHSLVNDQYPEVDKYEWVDIPTLENKVHEAQKKNIPHILELVQAHFSH